MFFGMSFNEELISDELDPPTSGSTDEELISDELLASAMEFGSIVPPAVVPASPQAISDRSAMLPEIKVNFLSMMSPYDFVRYREKLEIDSADLILVLIFVRNRKHPSAASIEFF
jgi:hypothetical protein